MSLKRHNSKKEEKLINESIFNITYDDIRRETLEMFKTQDLTPNIFRELHNLVLSAEKNVGDSKMMLFIVDMAAFAAMNVLRRKNGLEELIIRGPKTIRLSDYYEN